MNNKIYTLIILSIAATALLSTDFTPEIRIVNTPTLDNNELDYYQFEQGYSLSESTLYLLGILPTTTTREFFFEEGYVKLECKLGSDVVLGPAVYMPLSTYLDNNFRNEFQTILKTKAKQSLGDQERPEGEGLIPEIIIELPKIALPKAVRKLMGNKAGRLSLDGSTKVSISGNQYSKSTKSTGEGDQNKNFSLNMEQELNLSLRGTIGEKIHVNVSHRSSSDTDFISQPTEVNIKYIGHEDEIVKTIEAGNIGLSLSGSQYISYSASSEGLFGVKTELEAGNLKITSIIGKDEAKKNSKQYNSDSTSDSTDIRFERYEKFKYYYIHDPDEYLKMYDGTLEPNEEPYPDEYIGNAIRLTNDGEWILSPNAAQVLPQQGTLSVYLDDGNVNNDISLGAQPATTIDGDYSYSMHILTEGTDYYYDYATGIISFTKKYSKTYSIGVVYTSEGGIQYGANSPLTVKPLQNKNNFEDALMLRNIYTLGAENIQPEEFKFRIYQLDSTGGVKNENIPDGTQQYIKYLHIDNNDDNQVDSSDPAINFKSGIVVIPFLEPFANFGLEEIYVNDGINSQDLGDMNQIYVFAKGNIGRDTIELNDINIMPGTVKVKLTTTVETITLQEDVDYIVDYDFGNITLLSSKSKVSEGKISVDYQYKPLFSVESKTIYGMRADYVVNDNLEFGGTVVYESEQVDEDRPKIGSENRSIFMADLDGKLEYEVPFLTRLVDLIPFIKTDEDSKVSLSGEIAVSMPRIYGSDKQDNPKESYLDDMESIQDIFPLGVSRPTWTPASRPSQLAYGPTETIWFNPSDVYTKEIYNPETLTEDEKNEKVTTLSLLINPDLTDDAGNVGNPGSDADYWGGVMKYIGNQIDFSTKQYIEVLAKVDTLVGAPPSVNMHLDLGTVSEDYYQGNPSSPDTEDTINVDGMLDAGEDTGLDGTSNEDEGDTDLDDFDNEKKTYHGHEIYPDINKTEGNASLDSEDLDNDGQLNKNEVFFRYSINLNNTESEYYVDEYNGYRLFRIPLSDQDAFIPFSNQAGAEPTLEKISFARLWFDVEKEALVRIVNLDIVGNKWEERNIFNDETGETIFSESEKFQSGITDNQKESHYKPAPNTMIKKDGEVTLEQSLSIEYTNFQENHVGLTRQLFYDPSNISKGLNLLNYGKIRFWLYPESNTTSETDSLIVRFAADSLTYYEMRMPIKYEPYKDVMTSDGWQEIEIDFNDLTFLKNDVNTTDSLSNNGIYTAYTKDDREYRLYKNFTLSNLKQIYFGMKAGDEFNGTLYIDDIRVANPYEATAWAATTTFHTDFADFSSLDMTMKWLTPNFQTSINRKAIPVYSRKTEFNITNRYNLHKFFPADWGLSIPLTLNRTQSKGIPLYKANSDILRENLSESEKARQLNKSLNYTAGINFSQSKQPKNKILAYTLKNTSMNASVGFRRTSTPTSRDTTLTYNVEHNYNLSLDKDDLDIGIWGDYKLYFFPHTFNNKITYREEHPNSWDWNATITDTLPPHWQPKTQSNDKQTVNTSTTVKYDFTSDFETSYSFSRKLDLLQSGDTLFDYDIGKEMSRDQDISLDYKPDYMDRFFTVDTNLDINYNDSSSKVAAADTSGVDYKLSGGVDRNFGADFTIKNRDMLESLLNILGKDSPNEDKDPKDKAPGKGATDPKKSEPKGKKDENEKPGPQVSNPREQGNTSTNDYEGKMRDENRRVEDQIEGDIPRFGKNGKDDEIKQDDNFNGKEKNDTPKPEDLKGEFPKKEDKKTDDKKEEIDGKKDEAKDETDENIEKEPKERINLAVSAVTFLAKFENFSIDYDNKSGSAYSKNLERPGYEYQFGIDTSVDSLYFDRKTTSDEIRANSGMQILENLSTDVSGGYKISDNKTKSTRKRTITLDFPNISLQLTGFEKILRIDEILTSSRLSSSYSVSVDKTRNMRDGIDESETKRTSFSPLVSWNGNWLNNITSTTSVNLSYGDTKNHVTGSQSRSNNWSANGGVSWSFSAAKGINIPIFGKMQFKNELTTSLDLSMENSKSEQKPKTGDWNLESDSFRLTISPGASYKFSRNIDGGLDSSYEKRINRKNAETISSFRLGIWVEAQF